MGFDSGRVTFFRFLVERKAPRSVDPALLEVLTGNAFREAPALSASQIDAGFVTGVHLFDTQFTYEKNGFGRQLLFALRIDTHPVPPEIRRAYRVMNEQAMGETNPSGFASRGQKQEALETADRQVTEDLAAGRFRRSKLVPLLWDLPARVLYCGSSADSVREQLMLQMKRAFDVNLLPLSAGALGALRLKAMGRPRSLDDLRPSRFTTPPSSARVEADEGGRPGDIGVPTVPWTRRAEDRKDFLGNEFLIWLWRVSETRPYAVTVQTPVGERHVTIHMDRSLDMDCAWGATGRQSLRADEPGRLPEAGEALFRGKWPRRVGLTLADGAQSWDLSLVGDQMTVSSAKLPDIDEAESPRQLVEARLGLIMELTQMLDGLFDRFLDERTGPAWETRRQRVREWISHRRRGH